MGISGFNLTALFVVFHTLVFAQPAEVNIFAGRVVDFETKLPVAGLRVCAIPGSPCTLTDEEGFFKLPLWAGQDSIRIEGLGYFHEDYVPAAQAGISVTYGISQDPFALSVAVVEGFLNPATNASTPGTFGLIKRPLLQAGDQLSLQNSLNSIPGVVVENRGYGGSQRIQIRGSSLRAPFAVRNIKMYLNGIPFSSPDGTAPLELVDAADISSIEVIKGPAGSAWGSGTGGVLLIRAMESPNGGGSFEHNQTHGQFGISRYHTAVETATARTGIRISHIYQDNDGYRDQEFNRKQQISLMLRNELSSKWNLFTYATHYNGHWGLPGGLTAEDAETNPRAAIPFSAENNASLYRNRYFAGTSAVYRPNSRSSLTIAVYAMNTKKFNPFGTSRFFNGFKDEGAGGTGTRVTYARRTNLSDDLRLDWEGGTELQYESFYLTESSNDGGLPGDFRYRFETNYLAMLGFGAVDLTWKNRVRLHAGLSAGETFHDIRSTGIDDIRTDTTASWGLNWLPRAGLAVKLDSLLWINASISYGVSNPTIFEQVSPEAISTSAGFIRSRVNPESGVNYEVGIKGKEHRSGVEVEVSAYLFELNEVILPVPDSMPSPSDPTETLEFVRYANSGSTRQQGIEAVLRKSLINQDRFFIHRLDVLMSFTRSDYRFNSYRLDDRELNGNRLPGVALNALSTTLIASAWHERIRLSIQHFWYDRMPLNNANLTWLPAWNLLNARMDATILQSKDGRLKLAVHAGVNNALNTSYTSFANLNGTNGRFYNPSPPVNYYGGIRVSARFR